MDDSERVLKELQRGSTPKFLMPQINVNAKPIGASLKEYYQNAFKARRESQKASITTSAGEFEHEVEIYPVGRQPVSMYSARKEIRTPDEVLAVLDSVERDNARTQRKQGKFRPKTPLFVLPNTDFDPFKSTSSIDLSKPKTVGDALNDLKKDAKSRLVGAKKFKSFPSDILATPTPRKTKSKKKKEGSVTSQTRPSTRGAYIEDPPLAPDEDVTKPPPELVAQQIEARNPEKILDAQHILKLMERNKNKKYARIKQKDLQL